MSSRCLRTIGGIAAAVGSLAVEARADQARLHGSRGFRSTAESFGHRDNETAENIDDIADAIKTLKRVYRPRKAVLVGHSGGATVASVILGRYPGLADGTVLVSSPCDLVAWRAAHHYRGYSAASRHNST